MKPFTNNFPRADIHELLSPDLPQIIKGTFKDHPVDWVGQCIKDTYSKSRANEILADTDRRLVQIPFLVLILIQRNTTYLLSFLEYQRYHHSLGFAIFMKDVGLNNGRVMIPKG